MPIPQDKIQQFVVQFACRIPTRRELTAGEKRALENLLRELDPDHFQLPVSESAKDPALLFQVLRQNTIGASVLTSPTFVFYRDNFSFFYPIKMMNRYIYNYNSLETRSMNNPISSWSNRVVNAVNARCQRAGKIYLMVLGPFAPGDKTTVFQNLCSGNLNLNEIGEFNFTFAYYRDNETYNILNSINFVVNNLNDQFFVNVKVDINNRTLRQGLEPPDIERIWNFADTTFLEHLENMLNIT